jgi:hypothetical protein
MSQPDPSHPPSGFERARRMLFARADPSETVVVGNVDPADLTAAVERVVDERMQDAVAAIQETASSLMHEVAAEVWRTAGGDKRDVQAKLLEALTRDQAIRSLIAHSDERFQSLTVRTARLEDTLQRLADHTYEATESLTRGVHALEEAVQQPAVMEIGDLRDRLSNVVRQISRALETITERDRIIVEAIGERVREHGEVVTQETGRIAQAMESYVQQGVSAIGQLAGRVDTQLAETVGRFDAQTGELTRRVTGALTERIDALDRLHHERALALARLVRSDSEAIRDRLVRMTAEQDEALAHALDERLERASYAITTATQRSVDELERRLREEAARALEENATAATNTIDRNMLRLSDSIESQFSSLGAVVGQHTAQAAETAISGKFEATLDRMYSSATAIERAATDVQDAQRRNEEDLAKLIDHRLAALARMIRSDNEALADQRHQEQEAAKQSLRAVKELQANLPEQVLNVVERRIDGVAAGLERRIDEMTSKISQRYDNDIQVVVERMGDAMHALGSLGRAKPDRIELE